MKHHLLLSILGSRPTAQSHSCAPATVVLWFAFLLCKSVALGAASGPAVEGDAWWRYVQVLADDKMEGRNTGSEGYVRKKP